MTELARIATLQLDEEKQRWRLIYHPNADEIVECESLATLLFWLHPRAEEQLPEGGVPSPGANPVRCGKTYTHESHPISAASWCDGSRSAPVVDDVCAQSLVVPHRMWTVFDELGVEVQVLHAVEGGHARIAVRPKDATPTSHSASVGRSCSQEEHSLCNIPIGYCDCECHGSVELVDGREGGEPFGSGSPTRERPGFDSQPAVSPSVPDASHAGFCASDDTDCNGVCVLAHAVLSGDFGHTLADHTGIDPALVIVRMLRARGWELRRSDDKSSDDGPFTGPNPERMTVLHVGADGGGDSWEVCDGGKPILGIVDYPNGDRVFGTWDEDGEWELLGTIAEWRGVTKASDG